MPIDTVLIGLTADTDGDRLVEAGVDLATDTGTTVVVGVAYSESEHAAASEEVGVSNPDDLARRDEAATAVASRFEEAGISHEVRGSVGDEGAGLVSLAEAVDADRVLVQERQRSPTGKAVFGSAAQYVLLNAPCPVTYVRGE